jgi:hypothetical protein
VYLLVFNSYINEMNGSRSKIPSKNFVRQRCAEGFNSGVKELRNPEIGRLWTTSVAASEGRLILRATKCREILCRPGPRAAAVGSFR